MTTIYVTSAHYRTPLGCPSIKPDSSALQRARRLQEPTPALNLEAPPLQPSDSTLQKMMRRFKPRG
jgi:hypothetical protein